VGTGGEYPFPPPECVEQKDVSEVGVVTDEKSWVGNPGSIRKDPAPPALPEPRSSVLWLRGCGELPGAWAPSPASAGSLRRGLRALG
jgi:hypothetical protein